MIRTAVLIAALFAPLGLAAEGCQHEQSVSSCAEGFTWDTETRTCVKQILS